MDMALLHPVKVFGFNRLRQRTGCLPLRQISLIINDFGQVASNCPLIHSRGWWLYALYQPDAANCITL
jgi:hypothetical protein